ncbi:MAG: hypothetical protein HN736_04895 [Anaerolineae bacterium]|jgi:hypothetical protein|nr:hypothetical protein [Anaerolineae bacterium]MBT3713968.1 hypothetical protein [Anaerolineae bacterium]MBT4310074.1 hypothetical protein [Anaerolineae bacterium]MBT4457613.1 hypothetical protein [Anaerolineae bacterium]MBT4841108.1 hypothetical protein [Anaerolineae bacterium]
MEEAALNKITFTFIFLATLSAHHFYFGRNIPKWSWWLSIAFSIATGMYLGFVIAIFPGNIIAGSLFSLVVFLTNLAVRRTRNRQDTFFESNE